MPRLANDGSLKPHGCLNVSHVPIKLRRSQTWFDKLLMGSIENFHQLIEPFVAWFLINTKTPKGVGSLLTLKKGKNKTIRNYNKRYLETCNEIEEYSEELVVAS